MDLQQQIQGLAQQQPQQQQPVAVNGAISMPPMAAPAQQLQQPAYGFQQQPQMMQPMQFQTQPQGFQQPAMQQFQSAPIQILGVLVPVKIQTPSGPMRSYLQLPAELATNPQAFMTALQTLMGMGYQLDIWQPRQQQWGGNRGQWGGGGNGGWQQNRGGW